MLCCWAKGRADLSVLSPSSKGEDEVDITILRSFSGCSLGRVPVVVLLTASLFAVGVLLLLKTSGWLVLVLVLVLGRRKEEEEEGDYQYWDCFWDMSWVRCLLALVIV